MLHTIICDMLDIKYPIVLAGMGIVAEAELTAAVSEAGGLGVIGAFGMTGEQLLDNIRQVKKLTDDQLVIAAYGGFTHLSVGNCEMAMASAKN